MLINHAVLLLIFGVTTLISHSTYAETKVFSITLEAEAPPVGGKGSATSRINTETFRVSSVDMIKRDTIKATALEQGRGDSRCYFLVTKEVEETFVHNNNSFTVKFPTEIQLVAFAESPGCTAVDSLSTFLPPAAKVFIPDRSCIGKSSKQICRFTGEYTDQ